MNWLEEIKLDDTLNFNSDKEMSTDFTFKNLTMTCTSPTLTGIAQFFLNLSSMDKQSLIQLPISSESKLNSLIEELAIHYEVCKVLYVGAEPKMIILQNPKNRSLSLLNEVQKNPIINDIFRDGKKVNLKIDHSADTTVYQVIKNSFLSYTDREFDNIFNTLKMSYSKEGSMFITPKGWTLTESLKESVALRYFIYKCKNVYLWTSKSSNNVFYIQIEF